MDSNRCAVTIFGLFVALILGIFLTDLREKQAFIDAGYQKAPICIQMSAQWVAPSPKSALRNVLVSQ